MVTSKFRGHKIYKQGDHWYFADNDDPVATTIRPCGHYNRESTPEGHDACIGHLPGVMNACCGHGDLEEAYIQFPDGSIIRKG